MRTHNQTYYVKLGFVVVQWQLYVVVFACFSLDASVSSSRVSLLSDTVCGITSSSYPHNHYSVKKKVYV